MTTLTIVSIFLNSFFVLCLTLYILLSKRSGSNESNLAVLKEIEALLKRVQDIPRKTLNGIRGLNNSHKGVTGELIGFISLHGDNDRVVIIGDIVDFMAIQWPTEQDDGLISFIDIKSGKASLSLRQKQFRDMINGGKVKFSAMHVLEKD